MALSYFQAQQQILESIQQLSVEKVTLPDAAGRVLAEDLVATHPLPAFDNSAMDGYAIKTADGQPGQELSVTGYLPAGSRDRFKVEPGCAVRIMTGAPIPAGTEAVIPYEETDEQPERIRILKAVRDGQHIRRQAEDIPVGTRVISAGTLLRPVEICLLASFCTTTVSVYRRARVAILSTGDELQEIDELRFEGGVVNSNSWALAAAVRDIGAVPLMLGIARDNLKSLREKLSDGLQADALITSAGVSGGDRDLVREVLEELDVVPQFWKIDIKPGKPTAFGLKGATPVFSLPGNPVATLLTYEEFVRPALLKMMGHQQQLRPLFKARLQEPVTKKSGRLHLMRVAIEPCDQGGLQVVSCGDQNTGILRTLSCAQAIALLPAEREAFAAGDLVDIHLLGRATTLGS